MTISRNNNPIPVKKSSCDVGITNLACFFFAGILNFSCRHLINLHVTRLDLHVSRLDLLLLDLMKRNDVILLVQLIDFILRINNNAYVSEVAANAYV